MEFMIEAKDLTFEYPVYDENGNETGSVRAVDRMDILVQKGEFVEMCIRDRWKADHQPGGYQRDA